MWCSHTLLTQCCAARKREQASRVGEAVLGRAAGRGQGHASVIWKSVRLSLKLSPGSSTEPAIAPVSTCGLGSGVFCSNARAASAGGLGFLRSHSTRPTQAWVNGLLLQGAHAGLCMWMAAIIGCISHRVQNTRRRVRACSVF